jgi:hypothetical protein
MRFPSLYQINTRVVLQEIGVRLGRPAVLDDLPDATLDEIAARGFSWVWMLGVWQTGQAGRAVSRRDPRLLARLKIDLPDLREEDIVGSPFAISAYQVHRDFGGDAALARLRERLGKRGLKLLLDFVPNHIAPDHPWVQDHPEYLIQGSAEDLERQPQNYVRMNTRLGPRILAHGRDPYFDGWTDTIQLNYRHPGLREAQIGVLGSIADRCDGVRCDMAMLLEPSVIARTWGDRANPSDGSPAKDNPFWPEAVAAVRRRSASFLFVAEVYWDMEWTLQQEGFDFTYDKRLYDRLRDGHARPVREHLMADPSFSERCLRFLENHDEPRAAATFPPGMHQAAAVVAWFAPGMRFFHEGQLEGRKVFVSMHVGRRRAEPVDPEIRAFYLKLLEALAHREVHEGRWLLETCRPAWDGNPTNDQFIVGSWTQGQRYVLAVTNYGPTQAQCYVTPGLPDLAGRKWVLDDLMSDTRYQRDGDQLASQGLYLDLPPWGYHVFTVRPAS